MSPRPASTSRIQPDSSHRRALVVVAVLVVWMLFIAVRLFYLQSVQYEQLHKEARAQQMHLDSSSKGTVRGRLLDREGRELALSLDSDSCFAIPYEIENIEDTSTRLASLVGIDAAELARRFKDANQAKAKFIWLARRMEEGRGKQILDLNLKGIHLRQEPKRFYPNGSLAAHVLGFVGLDEVGLAGMEQFQNRRMRGDTGKVFVETDAHGNSYESKEEQQRAGQSIVLTIDQMIQYRVEQSLAAVMDRTNAKSGTVVVLDPRTGEILALANAPTFDPNNASDASRQSRLNGALENTYEPGSTFKIVAFSAAVEEGLVRPTDLIDCQMGSITVAGRLIHDHHPFGTLSIAEALAKSSNVAAIRLGLRVGNDRLFSYMTRFGFGSRTGIELPGETAGLLRPVARWSPSSVGSLAIGQEVGVTALQMASAFGALANGGVRISPHLVREIRESDGSVTYTATPAQIRVVSDQTARSLRGMLEGVTLNGTAKLAQLNGYSAAGKTGTAQKIDPRTKAYSTTKHVASFVGFAPVDNPAVVIVVVLDEPAGAYHGGDVAAPVFREIAEQILPGLNIAPDIDLKDQAPRDLVAQTKVESPAEARERDEQNRVNQKRTDTIPQVARVNGKSNSGEIVYALASRRAMLMPDLSGRSVRDAVRICAQLGLRLEAHGEGRAMRQLPAAGSELDASCVVRVEFGRSE